MSQHDSSAVPENEPGGHTRRSFIAGSAAVAGAAAFAAVRRPGQGAGSPIPAILTSGTVESKSNTCEGVAGAGVTTTNTSGPDQFSSISKVGTGTTCNFDSGWAHTGSTSVKFTLPASVAATTYVEWSMLSSDARKFISVYFNATALPTANARLLAYVGSGSLRCSLQVTTTGTIRIVNSAGSVIATSTATIPTSGAFRVEFEAKNISGSTGTVAARLYSGSNLEGWTPDTGGNLLVTGANLGGNIDNLRIGPSSSVTMTTAWSLGVDDIRESNQSQPGPLNGVYIVAVADMQPGAAVNPPPSVVAAQINALSPTPNLVLMPGDEANAGTATQYGFFHTMYGALEDITYAVPGNHDWGNVVGSGSLTNYDAELGTNDPPTNTPPHFVSFVTSNGWLIIGFDSSEQWTGSLNNPSNTYTAVSNAISANPGKPILAFWHHPRFSDGTNTFDPGGTGDTTVVQDIWNLLYDNKANLVLNGHCHSYQRMPKLGKTGAADSAGIREIIVGTGGSGLFTLTGAPGSSGVRAEVNSYQSTAYNNLTSKWFGYLEVWLTPTTYSWRFTSQNASGSEDPGAVLDSGGPVAINT